jgi:glycosyltransferase involved in cell wall biosynthesis
MRTHVREQTRSSVPWAGPQRLTTTQPDDVVEDKPAAVDLAVIIPAYNEAEGIVRTLQAVREVLATLAYTSEIIVIDDGSSDGTGERAQACGVRVITHKTNRGYGAALRTGVLSTAAEAVLIMDADCTYPPSAIPELYAYLDDADMAVGARPLSSRGMGWVRRPAKWFLNRFASYLIGRHIPDLNSGQRVMKRAAVLRYLHLMPTGFSFTSTITLALLANGHHVVYHPIDYEVRTGESKIKAAHFTSFLLLVVRAIVLFNPLKVFLPLGFFLFLIGAVKLVQDLILWNLSETAVMAFLAAIVIWSVGLLADMIARLQLQPPWRS